MDIHWILEELDDAYVVRRFCHRGEGNVKETQPTKLEALERVAAIVLQEITKERASLCASKIN